MLMSRYYYLMSDFYVHDDENTASTMVENFAEHLDELVDSGEANNKIVPIFIVRGGDEENPTYSLEPLYFIVIDGVPLIFSTCFRLSGESLESIDTNGGGGSFITEMLTYNNTHVYQFGAIDSADAIDPTLQQAVAGTALDVAILDFPWLTLSRGREFIKQLQAKQIILYHLPFSEDDVSGYRQSAEKAVSRWEQGNAQLLWQPLQTISL